MPTAIVTGATGILGREIVSALGRNPDQWSKVYALSRSKKESYPSTVHHSHIDLQSSASDQASQLQGISADYVFFAAYLAADSEQAHCDINGPMLSNFLDALAQTGASKQIKRVILVTGAKQYGVHLGPVKQPMQESDAWLTGSEWPPNFYYDQQRILADAGKTQGWDWTVTYPNDVLGVAQGNFMNLPLTLGLYALVTREMNGEGGALEFPGSETFYRDCFDCLTYAPLHADFCVWAATAAKEKVSNEAFNVVNGDAVSYSSLWPKIAKRFGLKVPPEMFKNGNAAEGKMESSEVKLNPKPPVEAVGGPEAGLKGEFTQGKVEQRIDLVKWSQRSDVKAAWEKVAQREGLVKESFEKATWGFLGFVLGRNYNLMISMSKARKAGWNGYIDTWEAMDLCFDGLVKEKVLPEKI